MFKFIFHKEHTEEQNIDFTAMIRVEFQINGDRKDFFSIKTIGLTCNYQKKD